DAGFIQALQSAAALLLPVNFDDESVDFIRYSMPTKVPAYLASGTPIVVYGPPNVAQIEYASQEGWAHVVTEQDITALSAAMDRILHDDALRDRVSTRALDLARRNHALPVVREAFQNAIARLT